MRSPRSIPSFHQVVLLIPLFRARRKISFRNDKKHVEREPLAIDSIASGSWRQ
jgi:hypothetical protein